jgi:hypothetical protein
LLLTLAGRALKRGLVIYSWFANPAFFQECCDTYLFFLSPPLPPPLPTPPLLPLSMLQLLLPLLDSSAAAALIKHLRHTL